MKKHFTKQMHGLPSCKTISLPGNHVYTVECYMYVTSLAIIGYLLSCKEHDLNASVSQSLGNNNNNLTTEFLAYKLKICHVAILMYIFSTLRNSYMSLSSRDGPKSLNLSHKLRHESAIPWLDFQVIVHTHRDSTHGNVELFWLDFDSIILTQAISRNESSLKQPPTKT